MNSDAPDTADAGSSPAGGALALPGDVMPEHLPVLPVTQRPVFPAQTLALVVDESRWLETLEQVGRQPPHLVGLVLFDGESDDAPTPARFRGVGTVARVHQAARGEGQIQLLVEGLRRFRVESWISRKPPLMAQARYPEPADHDHEDEIRAYAIALTNVLRELAQANPLLGEEMRAFFGRVGPNRPGRLADFAASLTNAPRDDLQRLLETFPLRRRMQEVLVLLTKELEVAKLQKTIRDQVESKLGDQQRKFFLREQLKVIQQELGIAKDDRTAEIERFRERLKGLTVPDAARTRIDEEMDKLAVLEVGSPEYAVTRNYLDWASALPWGKTSRDRLGLTHARRALDRDHEGLEDVKGRILEFIAAANLRGGVGGSILLLVGPPGVGKTSIGRAVAQALGRRFFRFSLGGMRDEAEIKGHRRTYIGALPGKLVQALKECGTENPVILLDELDKLGASYQGDPASALLEVLDPEQNSAFLDHYLDLRLDLSRVLFICTANQLDTIPGPLLDRMEVIRLPGYLTEEKLAIARRHLLPRVLTRTGLKPGQLNLTDAALRAVIEGHAREAGVRVLEQRLARIARRAALAIVEGRARRVRVDAGDLETYLGQPAHRDEAARGGVGVVTGLAWTPMGGAILAIETAVVHRKGRSLKLTGQLGAVMQESAEIAFAYVGSHLADLGANPRAFDTAAVHVHVPAGATPKDGPSAGVTIATALVSLARGQAARPLAMTGELTLTGEVMPVGGIREKLLAARRAGIDEVILPAANQPDLAEVPAHVKEGLTVHFAAHYTDVLARAFSARRRR